MREEWNIKGLLEWTTRYFTGKGIDSPRLEAEVLLAHVLKQERVYLYANFDSPVNSLERKHFRDLIKRRVQGEPSAYITGYKEFMSLKFHVNPTVLIPRPDTELMVEKILEIFDGQAINLCDVGTGSGAIAISLAHYLPEARVAATDISEQALSTARINAAAIGAEVDFRQGDLMTPLAKSPPFDLVTANLPYIPQNEYLLLAHEVKGFEPMDALLAPGDGLDIYRRLLPQTLEKIKPGGYLFIEIAYNQGEKAMQMANGFSDVEIIKDLGGRDRILKARKG